jgi:hypothetical protein
LPDLPPSFDKLLPPLFPAEFEKIDLPALLLPEDLELFEKFDLDRFAIELLESLLFEAPFDLLLFERLPPFDEAFFDGEAFFGPPAFKPFFEDVRVGFSASTLSLPTASAVKESSAAYSSSSVYFSSPATLVRPSSLA